MSPALENHKPRKLVYLEPIPMGVVARVSGTDIAFAADDRATAIAILNTVFDPSDYVVCQH